jgi:hypothetical protein
MPLTFQQMIDKTISYLNGAWTNKPKHGTVTALTLTGSAINTLTIESVDGLNTHRGPAIVEIDNSLIFCKTWDSNSGAAVVPPWGNGFEGSVGLAVELAGLQSTKVIIDPLWPRWYVGLHLIDAMRSLYPKLYGVKVVTLTSETLKERYLVPSDCDEILSMKIEGYGTTQPQREIKRRTLEVTNPDGLRYVSIMPIGVSSRPIIVRYRTKPVVPADPKDIIWTYATSLLPPSSEDVPCLRAAATLIQSSEVAKMQTYSVEQSDRSRFVQGGTGNSVSRRLQEMYEIRLAEEQQALQQSNPSRVSMRYN